MSFEKKIIGCYKAYKSIDNPDYRRRKLDLYCDFIELMCLFSNNDGVGLGDIQDRFFGTKDYKKIEERDEDENFINKILGKVFERISLYGDNYPLHFDEDGALKLKNELDWRNTFYLNLLLGSNLNIFHEFQPIITKEFESFSADVLKCFLPEFGIVKEFGENSDYKGYAKDKIKDLAKDIGLTTDDYEISGIDERNTKERGLDVIGWIPFSDNCKNIIVYLAQCACGKNTESKYHDTRRFENYLNFYKTEPQHVLFVPYSLINAMEGKFYHSDLIEKDFLIFERKRMINLFTNEDGFKNSDSFKIVNEFVKLKEKYV